MNKIQNKVYSVLVAGSVTENTTRKIYILYL
jgi:hypothetical protein